MMRFRSRFCAVVVALLVHWTCGCVADDGDSSGLAKVDVQLISAGGAQGNIFEMEVAATPQSRAKGLMFRRSLADRRGMLFIFPTEEHHAFWMKNTLIPLDIVFVSRESKVVGVVEHAAPLTEDLREVPGDSMYVLEFAAGTAKKEGIVAGSMIRVVGALPPAS